MPLWPMTFEALLVDATAIGSVVLIDIALAGDNAIVIGAVAARLPAESRRRAIFIGIAAAMLFRMAFAAVATQLLAIIGLLLAGGLLLLWVTWKMWRDLHMSAATISETVSPAAIGMIIGFWPALVRIVVADVSMSLDNVLAVAGAARHNIWILVFGLLLSVGLMGAAAAVIARLLARYAWLTYAGVAIIAVVACSMIWEGGGEVFAALAAAD